MTIYLVDTLVVLFFVGAEATAGAGAEVVVVIEAEGI